MKTKLIALFALLSITGGCRGATLEATGRLRFQTAAGYEDPVRLVPAPRGTRQTERGVTVEVLAVGSNAMLVAVNNTNEEEDIEIVWDKASFASVSGRSLRVVHGETRKMDTYRAQANSMVQNRSVARLSAAVLDYVLPVPPERVAPASAAPEPSLQELGILKLYFRQPSQGEWAIAVPVSVAVESREEPELMVRHEHRADMSTQRSLCKLTGIFFGGLCWGYVIQPAPWHRWSAKKSAVRATQAKYGKDARLENVKTRVVGWD